MDSALSFAATKIQPPRARSTRLSRPLLEAALRQALLQSRVVLLQAAAGFGKTSALAAALPGLPAGTALAWVSLDGALGAEHLHERTGGWPAGLRLGLAALRARPEGGAAPAALPRLMDRHLFEFLASEVLDDLPQPVHDFLLRTSVLPELVAAQAAAVSGDAQAAERLDEIERRSLFATALEGPERTLVLHDLFRTALQAGQSNKHIARVLDPSPHTVKRHVANILDKLALASRGQAAAWLLRSKVEAP